MVHWQWIGNPDTINKVLYDPDAYSYTFEGLKSADQIITITYDPRHEEYIVFWRA